MIRIRFASIQRTSATDFPGRLCSILFVPGCVLRCHYCYNPELVLPKKIADAMKNTMSEEEVLAKLDERKHLVDAVTLTGGEITIHKDLPDFILLLKEKGYKVKIDTNGTHPGMLNKILPMVDYVAMDVKATLDQEHYNDTIGVHHDIDNFRRSIELIRSSGVDHEFRTTVVPRLFKIEDFYRLSEELKGAKRHYIQQFAPKGCLNKDFDSERSYSRDELERIRSIMAENVEQVEIRGL